MQSPRPRTWSHLEVRDELDSTNSTLADLRGADPNTWRHLSALRAEHQTAGRGRLDRAWVTTPGASLTASIVLVPTQPRQAWASLTTVAGIAVVRVLRGLGADAALKWPNDVVLRPRDAADVPGWGGNRKVAGILAEVVAGRSEEASDAVVLGIGVNVSERALPVPWAASLADAGVAISPADLLDAIGGELAALWLAWDSGSFSAVRAEALAVCDTLGCEIEVAGLDGVLRGVAETLDGEARLVLRTPAGEMVTIAAGDVRQVRATANPAE